MIDPRRPDYDDTPVSSLRPRSWYARGEEDDDTPAVSIVTPFHSGGAAFRDTARSVFAQSFQQWEWILVDDAAPSKESRGVLAEFEHHPDPRIRVLHHDQQRGPGAARNTGVRAARSEYVFLLDDDDLLEPTAIEKTLWFLLSHPNCGFANGWSVGFGRQHYLWREGFERGARILDDNFAVTHVLLRKTAFDEAGGFDEAMRDGFEDWDFWLRCAKAGRWGATIPEFLSWYRRREHHGDRWRTWQTQERIERFRSTLRERYRTMLNRPFPAFDRSADSPGTCVGDAIPFSNRLGKERSRVLLLLPWLTMGGSDKFNLDLVERLSERGFEISIATTLSGDNSWTPEFTRHTSDVFHLPSFLRLADHPRFLAYLIQSRRPDAVFVSNSELGYLLLPYLRATCPGPVYLDYCHMEEEYWKNGGYPRLSVAMQTSLDATLVSSEHLKRWMVGRGAAGDRIDVAYTNIDTERWQRDPDARLRLRTEWEVRDDEIVVLFAGRLCDQKQPFVLVRALAELDRRGIAFRAVIAGDGELRSLVERSLRDRRITDRVRMLGSVSTHAMRDVMSAADLFFLPSRWEGIALSLFEAMAMQLVVVGADVGGQRELVTRECGVLLPASDEETEIKAYAEVLATLLGDAAELRAMGARARERVREQFRLDGTIDSFVAALERARAHPGRIASDRLSPDLARLWAEQAVDYVRLTRLADSLWVEREHLRARLGGADAAPTGLDALVAEKRLAQIEASRSWRWLQRAKRSLPYRAIARIRFGPGWDREAPSDDAALRLARIEASRAYRTLQALKRIPAYRWYARRRWGRDWDRA